MNNYQTGNTIRLEGSFFDFDNALIDPDVVKLIIYDFRYKVLETILMLPENKVGIGKYTYDYVTNDNEQLHYYEWYGEINGKPNLKRGKFTTKFI